MNERIQKLVDKTIAGEMWVDNVSLKKYSNKDAVEVNAALNAALVLYASEEYRTVLTNCELPAMTIGKSWIASDRYKRDLLETVTDNGDGTTKSTFSIKPENASTYKFVTDGPALTYEVDGEKVTAINVDKAGIVDLTITAEANGITESFTVERKVAPVAIRSLALGTANCLNGAWIDGADGTEKLIVAKYLDDKFVGAFVVDFADTEAWDALKGTGDRFDEANSIVNNLGTSHPNEAAEYDQLKLFVVDADGITPLAYANASLTE